MAIERREHIRYEPTSQVDALLIWEDTAGTHQSVTQLGDLSEGGCALISKEAPLPEALALVRLRMAEGDAAATFRCHVTTRNTVEATFLISLRFEQVSEQQITRLKSALASNAFRPLLAETALARRKHWRATQWAAFLTAQPLPVMGRSKLALLAFEGEKSGELSTNELVDLAKGDPYLCLSLLREAEEKRTSRLGNETITPLAAVMQLGAKAFRELLIASPQTDETNSGLAECEARAVLAGQLAAAWSSARADASPDQVLMAAMLSEIGELLLWHFAPELPQSAHDALATGKAVRTTEAQETCCGFKFQDLTLNCAETWRLPGILVQLIRGQGTARAKLARLSRDTARHLIAGAGNPALPDDLAEAKQLLPQAPMEWLVEGLKWVPREMQDDLVEKANLALNKKTKRLSGVA